MMGHYYLQTQAVFLLNPELQQQKSGFWCGGIGCGEDLWSWGAWGRAARAQGPPSSQVSVLALPEFNGFTFRDTKMFLFPLETTFNTCVVWVQWLLCALGLSLLGRNPTRDRITGPSRAGLWIENMVTKSGFDFNTALFSFIRSFEMLLRRLVIVIISATVISHKRWKWSFTECSVCFKWLVVHLFLIWAQAQRQVKSNESA